MKEAKINEVRTKIEKDHNVKLTKQMKSVLQSLAKGQEPEDLHLPGKPAPVKREEANQEVLMSDAAADPVPSPSPVDAKRKLDDLLSGRQKRNRSD